MTRPTDLAIGSLRVGTYVIPFEPESDGTLTWDRTTVVTVEVDAADETGIGWSYTSAAAATVVRDVLIDAVIGADAMDVTGTWARMVRAIRNVGRAGIASAAIAAVDTALWDLKARLLRLPLTRLLGRVRETVPLYWSGGFTSYPERAVTAEMERWVGRGMRRVKMKIGAGWGRDEDRDVARVRAVRAAVGPDIGLMVDANGAYTVAQATRVARRLEDLDVSWFEEPVSSDDLGGLRTVRLSTPIDVAAGEYAYDLAYVGRMCRAGAIDCLQLDVSRCAGITEFLRAAAVAAANGLDVSTHTAQALHAAPACAIPNLRHVEFFADHERVDRILFDGLPEPSDGLVRPDAGVPGTGFALKRRDAERFAA